MQKELEVVSKVSLIQCEKCDLLIHFKRFKSSSRIFTMASVS